MTRYISTLLDDLAPYSADMSKARLQTTRHDAPLVSVIVPTYNRWPLVRKAVKSVLAQDMEDVEVVVVDDGSTDGTFKRLGSVGERVRVVRQRNRERGAARSRGIVEARARFLAEVGMVRVTRKLEPLHDELAAKWIDDVPRCLAHTGVN